MTKRTAPTLMTTMTALNAALSLMPLTRISRDESDDDDRGQVDDAAGQRELAGSGSYVDRAHR